MLDRIAFVISIIFSPFLVFLPITLVLVQFHAGNFQQGMVWALVVTVFISLLPSSFIVILVVLGRLSDVHLSVRKQRLAPVCFSLVSTLVGTVILYQMGAPQEIVSPNIAYVLSGVLFAVITPLWKISFHSGSAAGGFTVLTLLVDRKWACLFLLLPLIAWARVHRKRHTYLQTITGAALATTSTAIVVHFSLRWLSGLNG